MRCNSCMLAPLDMFFFHKLSCSDCILYSVLREILEQVVYIELLKESKTRLHIHRQRILENALKLPRAFGKVHHLRKESRYVNQTP